MTENPSRGVTAPTARTDGARRVAARFSSLFPGERLDAVASADAMAAIFDRLEHQRPATCGAYVLSYLLPAIGFPTHAGIDLGAEDYLAHLASVVVEASEVEPSAAVDRRVAAGELDHDEALARHRREWYRWPVRASADPVECGTSPTGVVRAITIATGGQLVSLPIAARLADGSIQLTAERWEALIDRLAARTDAWRWHAIFNYETDLLLSPDDPSYTPEGLASPDVLDRVPLDDWGVGHFVGLAGTWRSSVTGSRWLLLFDTYKERGFDGYEPQPAELMRRGLVRDDGRGGGMLLVLPRDVLDEAAAVVRGLGLEPRTWDNGSPAPDDWRWEPGR